MRYSQVERHSFLVRLYKGSNPFISIDTMKNLILITICYFYSLFFIGNPYFSLTLMIFCFIFFCWALIKLIRTELKPLIQLIFFSVILIISYASDLYIIFFLLAVKLLIPLSILSFLLALLYPNKSNFAKSLLTLRILDP